MRPLIAHCHLGLGGLHRRTGDPAAAQAYLTTAAGMFREMDMSFWLDRAEAALMPSPSRHAPGRPGPAPDRSGRTLGQGKVA
jgi:hypothetical protein